jgi:Ca2+-transporting ATPase
MILMYFGGLILFEKSINLVFDPLRNNDGSPSDRLRLDSIIFNTFVLMNLFNQINCRIVSANELNVFKTILNNIWFWLIILFELGVQ